MALCLWLSLWVCCHGYDMRLLDCACDYPLHKVLCAHGCPVGYAAMVMTCLSDHMITAITWYKYHMRVVILVAMLS